MGTQFVDTKRKGRFAVMVKFMGHWAIYYRYSTKKNADLALEYWKEQVSWPLRVQFVGFN